MILLPNNDTHNFFLEQDSTKQTWGIKIRVQLVENSETHKNSGGNLIEVFLIHNRISLSIVCQNQFVIGWHLFGSRHLWASRILLPPPNALVVHHLQSITYERAHRQTTMSPVAQFLFFFLCTQATVKNSENWRKPSTASPKTSATYRPPFAI